MEGKVDRLISKRKCIAVSTLLTRCPPFPVALIPVSSISQSDNETAFDISSMANPQFINWHKKFNSTIFFENK
jgi:hypothetical protein